MNKVLYLIIAIVINFTFAVWHIQAHAEAPPLILGAPPNASDQPPTPVKSPFEGAKTEEKRPIDIALDNMDIYPVLDLVLAQILGLNYVVDPAIKGQLSLHIHGNFTRDELLNLLNSSIQLHGISIVRGDMNLYKVIRKPDTGRSGADILPFETTSAHFPGDIVKIYQLKYILATNAAANLRNFLSNGAVIIPEQSSNSLIVADTAENLDRLTRILGILDVTVFSDMKWRIFTLENSFMEDIAKDIEKLFQANGIYKRPGLDPLAFQVIPLKSINGLLLVTKWDEMLTLVEGWIKELDQKQVDKGSQVVVYTVKNGKADEIADTLRQVYGLSTSSLSRKKSKSKKDKDKSVIARKERESISATTHKDDLPAKEPSLSDTGELAGDVEIIPDEVNNLIIIKARPRDYTVIQGVLKQLDVLPKQVLIDVMIVDVTLKNDFEFGVEWFLSQHGIDINSKDYNADIALANGVTLSQNTALGKGLKGLSYGLFNGAGELKALISTLASKTDVNILSSPSVLAVDNQESSIEVGDEVPTLSSTTETTVGTTQSIQYKNAGIILKVKPYINDSGLVRMEVSQEVSSVTDETTGGINSPRFRTRKADTYIVARDKQTILIGGLMQTQKTKTSSGVPFLKDIPLLGYAFGANGSEIQKSELLIAITPHIVTTREQADALTMEFTNKVSSLKKELELIKQDEVTVQEDNANEKIATE